MEKEEIIIGTPVLYDKPNISDERGEELFNELLFGEMNEEQYNEKLKVKPVFGIISSGITVGRKYTYCHIDTMKKKVNINHLNLITKEVLAYYKEFGFNLTTYMVEYAVEQFKKKLNAATE